MWLEAVVIGIVIGLARGGRIAYLAEMRLKHVNLFLVGLAIQILPFFFGSIDFFRAGARYMSFAGYMVIVLFLILNLKSKGVFVILVGAFMNVIALLTHDYRMPISFDGASEKMLGLKLQVLSGQVNNYLQIDEFDSIWDYLGKIIPMPNWYPLIPILSMADIVIAVGIVFLLQNEISEKRGFFV